MSSVLIIDDERDARDLLTQYLGEYPGFRIIGYAEDGVQAVRMTNALRPDLIFLDVQMPGYNGFEVLTQLEEIPRIIFSTAYDQYALKAFEVHALDYLLKPYGRDRFQKAMARLEKQQDISSLAEDLLTQDVPYSRKVILQKGQRKLLMDVDKIFHISAFGNYSKVHFREQTLLSNSGISELANKLDARFFVRVHRSHLVNLAQATELQKAGRYEYLLFPNGDRVKVGGSYLLVVRQMIL